MLLSSKTSITSPIHSALPSPTFPAHDQPLNSPSPSLPAIHKLLTTPSPTFPGIHRPLASPSPTYLDNHHSPTRISPSFPNTFTHNNHPTLAHLNLPNHQSLAHLNPLFADQISNYSTSPSHNCVTTTFTSKPSLDATQVTIQMNNMPISNNNNNNSNNDNNNVVIRLQNEANRLDEFLNAEVAGFNTTPGKW